MTSLIVWHYTTKDKMSEICDSSELRPATAFVDPDEKPILWFSFDQFWEYSANKGIIDGETGKFRTATKEETWDYGGGLFRIGVSVKNRGTYYIDGHDRKFYPWRELPKKANMKPEIKRALEKVSSASGSNPLDWVGVFEPIPWEDFNYIQFLDENEKWRDLSKLKKE